MSDKPTDKTTADQQAVDGGQPSSPAQPNPDHAAYRRPQRTPTDNSSVFKRPEVVAAAIGALGVVTVPFINYALNRPAKVEGLNSASPPAIQTEPSGQTVEQPSPKHVPPEPTYANAPTLSEPESRIVTTNTNNLPDNTLISDDYFTVNGINVEPRNETRIIENANAVAYPVPSSLRQSVSHTFSLGDQVKIIGKVVDAPWYVIKIDAEYDFIRTHYFSKNTTGRE